MSFFEAVFPYAYISLEKKIKKKYKLTKVTCDIFATKILVEGGSNSLFCKNCDQEMFV